MEKDEWFGHPATLWDIIVYTDSKISSIEIYGKVKFIFRKVFMGVGRNDLCSCGSGNKYNKCCLNKRTDIKQIQLAEDV